MTLLNTTSDPLSRYLVLVAIDFGTTYSGCSFAYISKDKTQEPRSIKRWPGQKSQYAKVPTLSIYKPEREKTWYKEARKHTMTNWGWESKDKVDFSKLENRILLDCVKLCLDESLDKPSWANIIPISTAISDYLRAFHMYATNEIIRQFERNVSCKDFRYCLTVPAMWSKEAKDTMRKAAIDAGIIQEKTDHPDRLILISEPEAAAHYCERSMKEYDIKHGDQFMICDAGGGTVDLIIYEMNTSAKGQHLIEVTKGFGSSCGSTFIDMKFSHFLMKKFGRRASKFPKSVIAMMVDTFSNNVKPYFDGVEEEYILTLPNNKCFDTIPNKMEIGINDGYLTLKHKELKEVFDPVVEKVLKLIGDQLASAKECSTIIMVGGFGTSKYLQNRIKEQFGNKITKVLTPNRPELAVVNGAVYEGLRPRQNLPRKTSKSDDDGDDDDGDDDDGDDDDGDDDDGDDDDGDDDDGDDDVDDDGEGGGSGGPPDNEKEPSKVNGAVISNGQSEHNSTNDLSPQPSNGLTAQKDHAEIPDQRTSNDTPKLQLQPIEAQKKAQFSQKETEELQQESSKLSVDNLNLRNDLDRYKNEITQLQQDNASLQTKSNQTLAELSNIQKEFGVLQSKYMTSILPLEVTNDDSSTIYMSISHLQVKIETLIAKARGLRSINMDKKAAIGLWKRTSPSGFFSIPVDNVDPYLLDLFMESMVMGELVDRFFTQPLGSGVGKIDWINGICGNAQELQSAVRWRQQLCIMISQDSDAKRQRQLDIENAITAITDLVTHVYPGARPSKVNELCELASTTSFAMYGFESIIFPTLPPLGTPFDDKSMRSPFRSNPKGSVSLVIFPMFTDGSGVFKMMPKVWCL